MKKTVYYKIAGFELTKFIIRIENYNEHDDVNVGTEISFAYNSDERVIRSTVNVVFSQNDKVFLEEQLDTFIEIRKDSMDLMKEGSKIRITSLLQCQFASFGYGALRGIMYLKTMNTPISGLILPPNNLSQMINEDILINIEKVLE